MRCLIQLPSKSVVYILSNAPWPGTAVTNRVPMHTLYKHWNKAALFTRDLGYLDTYCTWIGTVLP